jgi:hypothetical protein
MKAYLIDVAERDVRAVEYEMDGATTLQTLIGGYIEIACSWENGDVLFVDEEGLFKPQRHFFRIDARPDQPMAGNGVLVGREITDDQGEYVRTEPPTMSIEELRAKVQFIGRSQADAWAKGNASEPASTISFIGEDGTIETEVIGRMGALFAAMPQPSYPVVVDSFGVQMIGTATSEGTALRVLREWLDTERPTDARAYRVEQLKLLRALHHPDTREVIDMAWVASPVEKADG